MQEMRRIPSYENRFSLSVVDARAKFLFSFFPKNSITVGNKQIVI